jgi:hypothetical protein
MLTQGNAVDLNTVGRVPRIDGRRKIVRVSILSKQRSLFLHDLLSTGLHLLDVSFVTSLKSHLRTNHVEHYKNNCITSHAKNTTAIQSNTFLNEIHQLLFTNKGRSGFHSANICQGQLQTPQSVSVLNQYVVRVSNDVITYSTDVGSSGQFGFTVSYVS